MKNDNICACFSKNREESRKKTGSRSKNAFYRVADGFACCINGQLFGRPEQGAGTDNKFGETIPPGADDWDNAGYN